MSSKDDERVFELACVYFSLLLSFKSRLKYFPKCICQYYMVGCHMCY